MRYCFALLLCFSSLLNAEGATGRVLKVLPHFLDLKGRHTISPSLFDRDAYQAVLRQHPEQRSALRFDIEWKSKGSPDAPFKIRAEVRGVARENLPMELTLERTLEPAGWFGRWTSLTLKDEDYRKLGEPTAWRVTLWDGTRLLSEQKSFLW
jgi:hypothetical protein